MNARNQSAQWNNEFNILWLKEIQMRKTNWLQSLCISRTGEKCLVIEYWKPNQGADFNSSRSLGWMRFRRARLTLAEDIQVDKQRFSLSPILVSATDNTLLRESLYLSSVIHAMRTWELLLIATIQKQSNFQVWSLSDRAISSNDSFTRSLSKRTSNNEEVSLVQLNVNCLVSSSSISGHFGYFRLLCVKWVICLMVFSYSLSTCNGISFSVDCVISSQSNIWDSMRKQSVKLGVTVISISSRIHLLGPKWIAN